MGFIGKIQMLQGSPENNKQDELSFSEGRDQGPTHISEEPQSGSSEICMFMSVPVSKTSPSKTLKNLLALGNVPFDIHFWPSEICLLELVFSPHHREEAVHHCFFQGSLMNTNFGAQKFVLSKNNKYIPENLDHIPNVPSILKHAVASRVQIA